jgi:hypothetical protein
MANSRGGLILIGIREDNEVAVEAPGVDLEPAFEERIRDAVGSRVRPFPRYEVIRIQLAESATRGFWMIVVARSSLEPHLVISGSADRPLFGCPRRRRASTVWLSEIEVAASYRQRIVSTAAQQRSLDLIEGEMKAWLGKRRSWLVVSLVPDIAGEFSLSQDGVQSIKRWARNLRSELFPESFGLALEGYCVPAFRRLRLSEHSWDGSARLDSDLADLYFDGSFVAARPLAEVETVHVGMVSPISIQDLTSGCLAMSKLAARHSLENSGSFGGAVLKLTLIPPDVLGATMWLVDTAQTTRPAIAGSRGVPSTIEASAPVELEDIAYSFRRLCATVRQLLGDLTSAFGLAEPLTMADDGMVLPGSFGPASSDIIGAWLARFEGTSQGQ